MTFRFYPLLLLALGTACLHAAPAPVVIEDFNRPFLFSYLSWEQKAFTSNGVAVLRGFNNQGGTGLNGEWNLASQAALIPALKLKVGPGNKAAALVLMLKDAGEGEGRWEFPLPAAGTDFTTMLPRDGAALAGPNAIGKNGKPDLAQVRQLQLIGDWAGGNAVGRFPEPGDDELLAGPSRNLQVFDPLDFLAEVTQHTCLPAGRSPIRAAIWCATTDGTRTCLRRGFGRQARLAASGPNGNRRRPERGLPPAPPRRGRPAKAGRP